jgi:hypothetical protein
MRLALRDLFRAKWSQTVHDEWIEAALRDRPKLDRKKLERTRALMDAHVRDCLVEGYEELIASIVLPDPGDRHVLAAAIRGGADTIVTMNLKDFPAGTLAPYGMTRSIQTPSSCTSSSWMPARSLRQRMSIGPAFDAPAQNRAGLSGFARAAGPHPDRRESAHFRRGAVAAGSEERLDHAKRRFSLLVGAQSGLHAGAHRRRRAWRPTAGRTAQAFRRQPRARRVCASHHKARSTSRTTPIPTGIEPSAWPVKPKRMPSIR